MANSLLEQFEYTYQAFSRERLPQLAALYSEAVIFEDPLHRLEGRDALLAYFEQMAANLLECRFQIHQRLVNGGEAALWWTMDYRHRRLAGGRQLTLEGSSHLRWHDRISYHRDYFDVGAMVYEHLPLLGGAIRALKRRLI